MKEYIPDILKIGIPLIFGLVSSLVAYILGRKKQIDELMLEKTVDYARSISSKLQEIHESYERLYKTWKSNFDHIDFHQAIESFERYNMYDNEKEDIKQLMKRENELNQLHKESAIFVKNSFRKKFKQYLNLGQFTFEHDEAGIVNNYYEKFFENLINKREKRVSLFNELERDFQKLIK